MRRAARCTRANRPEPMRRQHAIELRLLVPGHAIEQQRIDLAPAWSADRRGRRRPRRECVLSSFWTTRFLNCEIPVRDRAAGVIQARDAAADTRDRSPGSMRTPAIESPMTTYSRLRLAHRAGGRLVEGLARPRRLDGRQVARPDRGAGQQPVHGAQPERHRGRAGQSPRRATARLAARSTWRRRTPNQLGNFSSKLPPYIAGTLPPIGRI